MAFDTPPPPPPAAMPMAAMSEAKVASGAVAQDAIGGVRNIVPNEPGGGQPVANDNRQIAYTYTRTLRAPTTRMQDLLNAHKAACDAAGPARCYVSNSSISGLGTDSTSGTLELHATPEWIKPFLDGLPESLKPFEATVDASNTSSEDLTVQIVDTSARLNSSKMLRERLNALLKDRPGKLSDLLDIERELARVQAEIDFHRIGDRRPQGPGRHVDADDQLRAQSVGRVAVGLASDGQCFPRLPAEYRGIAGRDCRIRVGFPDLDCGAGRRRLVPGAPLPQVAGSESDGKI